LFKKNRSIFYSIQLYINNYIYIYNTFMIIFIFKNKKKKKKKKRTIIINIIIIYIIFLMNVYHFNILLISSILSGIKMWMYK